MSKELPFLFIVTAGDCGHCKKMKDSGFIENLHENLNGKYANVINLSLPRMDSPIPSTYPADLRNYVKWFPTFLLVGSSSYKRFLQFPSDTSLKLNVSVFNGILDENKRLSYKNTSAVRPDFDNIKAWILEDTPKVSLNSFMVKGFDNKNASNTTPSSGSQRYLQQLQEENETSQPDLIQIPSAACRLKFVPRNGKP